MAIEHYNDITADDNHRYNDIVRMISDGITITPDDAIFYGEFCAAVAAYDIETQARADAIKAECEARVNEMAKTEKTARTGYNKLVNAALTRYETIRSAANEQE